MMEKVIQVQYILLLSMFQQDLGMHMHCSKQHCFCYTDSSQRIFFYIDKKQLFSGFLGEGLLSVAQVLCRHQRFFSNQNLHNSIEVAWPDVLILIQVLPKQIALCVA